MWLLPPPSIPQKSWPCSSNTVLPSFPPMPETFWRPHFPLGHFFLCRDSVLFHSAFHAKVLLAFHSQLPPAAFVLALGFSWAIFLKRMQGWAEVTQLFVACWVYLWELWPPDANPCSETTWKYLWLQCRVIFPWIKQLLLSLSLSLSAYYSCSSPQTSFWRFK